jgi:hypothetical protein
MMQRDKTRAWAKVAMSASLGLAAAPALAQSGAAAYPAMASRDQYMMDRTEEIALARSAGPSALSKDATILVLGAHGFETAAQGKRPFTCLVERSWDKPFDDPEFWNQKMRGPVCMNDAAVRTVLPMLVERAAWALSGKSKDEIARRSKTSSKALMAPAPGAMSYMLSKAQYLSDDGGHPWYPHVMFFSPVTDGGAWGAGKGSPVISGALTSQITLFFIPVRKWSDGTLADYGPQPTETEHRHGN